MRFRLVPVAACTLAGLVVAACDNNPIYGNAVFATGVDTVRVFAINGTPISSPSAISVFDRRVTRAEAGADGFVVFDMALDIDAAGKIVVLPSKLVAADARGAAARVIGFQTTTTGFEALREAPNSGYKYDSLLVANVGQTVLIDSRNAQCTQGFLPNIYAKLVVDSITAGRVMHVRLASDPNCGFRGLVPGEVPKK